MTKGDSRFPETLQDFSVGVVPTAIEEETFSLLVLGALVSTAQLAALAERFAQTSTGQDLTGQRDRTLTIPLPLRAALPLGD